MDNMKGMKRCCYCGDVALEMSEVIVGGFTQRVRDKGGFRKMTSPFPKMMLPLMS